MPMLGSYLMDDDRKRTLLEIKGRIEHGNYRVDVRAVADAIVHQLCELAPAGAELLTPCDGTVQPKQR